jgi:hypothetical protein
VSAEDALAKLEARVLARGGVKAWLDEVAELRTLLALGDPDVGRIVATLKIPAVEAQALAAVLDAFRVGADDALVILRDAGIDDVGRTGRPSDAARAPVKGLDRAGREVLDAAKKLARIGAPPDEVLAPIFGHANRLESAVTTSINRSGNEGTTAIADAADLPTVWVAEYNACVHCLAYSGRVAKPGKTFPGGLTYGKKSYYPDPLKAPPLHPRCRCVVEPLHDDEYADALRREADRSVLRGFSLESESMGVRIDAAERLIASDPNAPASVVAYARRAVKAGEFTTRGRPR